MCGSSIAIAPLPAGDTYMHTTNRARHQLNEYHNGQCFSSSEPLSILLAHAYSKQLRASLGGRLRYSFVEGVGCVGIARRTNVFDMLSVGLMKESKTKILMHGM
jgi:hypothetical protein